jgi:exopolysaccharide production protein ExoZ
MTNTTLPVPEKPRLHGLDYLRGLSAFGIMLYHCSSWTLGPQPASSLLGKIGIYGVATFYILSGTTLGYVYQSTLQPNVSDLWTFYKRRIYRIFPLLWLATLASIVLSKHAPNKVDLFLNLTGLFGLFKWNTYFATGAWSIGNELTFYLVFPIAIFLCKYSRIGFGLLLVTALGLFVYFAYQLLNQGLPLAGQWQTYTNPLNQVFLFLAGLAISTLVNPNKSKLSFCLSAIILGGLLFWLIPVQGNAIQLVTDSKRILFGVACILICGGFFRATYATSWLEKLLAQLGQSSYSLYLLHPIVYAVVKAAFLLAAKRGIPIAPHLTIIITVLASLLVSYFSYIYFEKYFINISHRQKII